MMTAVMVDSNVLLDLMTEDTRWLSWSAEAVEEAADRFRPITASGFFIGAHAAVAGYRLLTRAAARYRSYFPRLSLIAPD
jgi:predicted nucleic acid-binding protein